MRSIIGMLTLGLLGCAGKGSMPGTTVVIENGCTVHAAGRLAALETGKYLKTEGVEYARMLNVFGGSYGDGASSPGHTFLIYMSPAGANRLWQWDARGSARIRAWKDDAQSCARAVIPRAEWGTWTDL